MSVCYYAVCFVWRKSCFKSNSRFKGRNSIKFVHLVRYWHNMYWYIYSPTPWYILFCSAVMLFWYMSNYNVADFEYLTNSIYQQHQYLNQFLYYLASLNGQLSSSIRDILENCCSNKIVSAQNGQKHHFALLLWQHNIAKQHCPMETI